jgi:pimeloyl-ACP methyl ester carboxylesterase
VAVTYAARHPERVSHLILYCAHARGWQLRGDADEIEARSALTKLVRLGWGGNNPAFRQLFTTRFIPDAGPAEMEWFNDLQRMSASPENAARFLEHFSRIDARHLLADVKVPTIVFHCQGDIVVPLNEGRLLAAGIRGAKFVPLPSRNHLLLENEPAWQIFLRELGEFLGWPTAHAAASPVTQ